MLMIMTSSYRGRSDMPLLQHDVPFFLTVHLGQVPPTKS